MQRILVSGVRRYVVRRMLPDVIKHYNKDETRSFETSWKMCKTAQSKVPEDLNLQVVVCRFFFFVVVAEVKM